MASAMLRTLLVLLQAAALLFGAGFVGAQDLQPVPQLTARVTDLTATLSAEEVARLDAKLATFERSKGTQIAVLLVPTVKPEAIEQYSMRVVEAWKLGRKSVDDGALLLAAKQDRKLRIEVGYGLEGALTDAAAKRIVSETIAPRFKQNDFYGGIEAGVDAMIQVIGGEPLPPPRPARTSGQSDGGSLDSLLPVLLVVVFVGGGILRAIFGRFLGAGIIAGVAGGIVWLLLSSLLLGGVAAIIAFVVSLLGGMPGGGFSSGGGSWGGGSGGFSGGGGGFGGGGASGDW